MKRYLSPILKDKYKDYLIYGQDIGIFFQDINNVNILFQL